ncbi:MAG: hypothetical protein F6J98_19160 [Moorea sp. SIO4G2]|nr:hypothetical protein [Moorena sp. SIO4G2]
MEVEKVANKQNNRPIAISKVVFQCFRGQGIGNRESGIGNRESGIGSRE